MKSTSLKTVGASVLAVLTLTMFAQISASTQDLKMEGAAREKSSKGAGARALEGSWSVVVTPRNCQTGAAGNPFPRMNTFMQGGTMQEFAAAVAPSRRTPGHGVWSHSTERSFSYSLQFFRFNADGTFAGSVRERRQVEVDADGNAYTATGTGALFDANGNPVLDPNGNPVVTCATETAARFE